MEFALLALGVFILLAYTLEAVTGFGSIVIALSLGILVLPIDMVLPILVALNIPMSATIAYKNRQNIHSQLLFKVILPGMLLGTVTGYLVKPFINEELLKMLFGFLIIWFSSRELWRMHHAQVDTPRAIWMTRLITYVAGITHGLFASGGPLLVYAVAGANIDKSAFRATMAVVWLSMNSLLFVAFIVDGRMQPLFGNIAWYLPLLFVAVKLGNYLHHKLDEKRFKIGIYYLLLTTGGLLVASKYLR
jgi:uncharacterized membrane protein YfcA